jgi:alanyl-tRNA synthetase
MSTKPELKIIADHLRSSCFLIADGILPSNEGRGYVLRRIMRRGMRQLHKLGAREASMYKLVDALIKEMGGAYPELARAKAVIVETLKNEEEKFRETLEKGLKILEEEISKTSLDDGLKAFAREPKNKKFSGEVAFKLYDTYGFPLDLTQDILKEKNIEVDLDAFNSEMEKQRNRGKENWSGSGETKEDNIFFSLKEKFGETKFLGYETLTAKAKILAIEEVGKTKQKIIILDQTPFYGTSGGQVGDDGTLKIGDKKIEISETKKFAGNLFVHFAANSVDGFKVGDEVEAVVNKETRQSRASNHSATHLLHKALKEVLGNSISQKGSNVDFDGFTFDFNFNRAMTPEEIKKVEDLINSAVKANNPVNTNLMDLEKARESGAEALFGEKYDSEVRVVKMGNSIELCGGTHVKNTSEIEIIKIISEKSVASGIRRIEAKSSTEAKKYLEKQKQDLTNLVKDLHEKILKKDQEILQLSGVKQEDTNAHESEPKVLEEILKRKDKEIERLKKQNIFANLGNLKSEKVGAINFLTHTFEDLEAKEMREVTTEIKARSEFSNSHILAFFGCKDGKVAVSIAVTNDLLEKFDSAKLIAPVVETLGGKGGGGKKDLAMGGGIDKDKIPQAIEVLKKLIS